MGKGFYMKAIRDMVQNKRRRLIVGIDDLRNFSLDFARRSESSIPYAIGSLFKSCCNSILLVFLQSFRSMPFYPSRSLFDSLFCKKVDFLKSDLHSGSLILWKPCDGTNLTCKLEFLRCLICLQADSQPWGVHAADL